METLWIAKAQVDGRTVYLPEYTGRDRSNVLSRIWFKGLDEGFKGTATERLAELGWEVVEIEFREVQDCDREPETIQRFDAVEMVSDICSTVRTGDIGTVMNILMNGARLEVAIDNGDGVTRQLVLVQPHEVRKRKLS